MVADCYYGSAAAEYDKLRNKTPGRQRERAAIAKLITDGPVLDAPVGTGAFGDIYRGMGGVGVDSSNEMLEVCNRKHPWMKTHRLDLTQPLPFEDAEFATALCVRFFWWTPDGAMQQVMKELRRVSQSVVFSIRISKVYGRPEHSARKSLGHTRAQLTEALGNWKVTDDIPIAGEYRMMRAIP